MAKQIKMSAEGYKKLEKELDYLRTTRRTEVAQKLKEARSFGDLSENAEYDEAKNEQGILEAEIVELEYTLANAVVIDDSNISEDEVDVGVFVVLRDMELNEEEKLQIVSSTEADPENGKISDDSPIGMAALKHKVGDVIEVNAPAGVIEMKIISISRE